MNTFLLLRMAQKPLWWIVLLMIPVLGLIIGVQILHQGISVRTRHGHGMTIMIMLLPFIFLPIVAHTFHPVDQIVNSNI